MENKHRAIEETAINDEKGGIGGFDRAYSLPECKYEEIHIKELL